MDEADLIVAAFVILVWGAVFGFLFFRSKAHEDRLTFQAEKRGGTFVKGGLFKQAELRIPFKEWTVVISPIPGSRYRSSRTVAQVRVDAPRLPIILMERNYLLQKILAAFGRERLLTGDEEFDHRWVMRTSDTLAAHKLVTAEFKEKLEERILRTLVVKIQPLELSLIIVAIPSNDEEYDIFIETIFLILRKFL